MLKLKRKADLKSREIERERAEQESKAGEQSGRAEWESRVREQSKRAEWEKILYHNGKMSLYSFLLS